MTYFVDEEHQVRFNQFLKESNVSETEHTVKAVLYVLSSVPILANHIEDIFVLKGKYINPDGIDKIGYELSTGQKLIIAVAFNLYNGFKMEGVDLSPYSILSWLDAELKKVYLESLSIKMGK